MRRPAIPLPEIIAAPPVDQITAETAALDELEALVCEAAHQPYAIPASLELPRDAASYREWIDYAGPLGANAIQGLARLLPGCTDFHILGLTGAEVWQYRFAAPGNLTLKFIRPLIKNLSVSPDEPPAAYMLWLNRRRLQDTTQEHTSLRVDLSACGSESVTIPEVGIPQMAVIIPAAADWVPGNCTINWLEHTPSGTNTPARVTFPARYHQADPNPIVSRNAVTFVASDVHTLFYNSGYPNRTDITGDTTGRYGNVLVDYGEVGLACYGIWRGLQTIHQARLQLAAS
jgi:hypothetical protein